MLSLILGWLTGCPLVSFASAQVEQRVPSPAASGTTPLLWQEPNAEHAYGLPDVKPKTKGVLNVDAKSVTFNSKSAKATIKRSAITTVESGNQRVEVGGTGGRIMRMLIPYGGGMAAGAMMHHRIDMLTIAFEDKQGGVHSVVFYLPATDAAAALKVLGSTPSDTFASLQSPAACQDNPVEPNSVLIEMPDWKQVDVPIAYRALVYEHIIRRLKEVKGIGQVYRYGSIGHGTPCPQYTIKIAIDTYKQGNEVLRASTGPIGMFAGATQMTFTATYTNATGTLSQSEQVKGAVRTDSESTGIADSVAKKLAKQYGAILHNKHGQQSASAARSKS